MSERHIRPIAICVFSNDGCVLVFRGYDSVKGEEFYRPLGGGIEFGEHSRQAVVREIREEIGAEAANVRYLGTLENLYTLEGKPYHEIVQVYDGELVDRSLYLKEWLDGAEDDGSPIRAYWKSLDGFMNGSGRLVPEGLLELLQAAATERSGL